MIGSKLPVNRERIQKLVDALKSGEFPQGRFALGYRLDGVTKYCCLGVACEVARQNGLDLTVETKDMNSYIVGFIGGPGSFSAKLSIIYGGEQYSLPPAVQEWYGLARNPDLLFDGHMTNAISLNDSDVSFRTIAKAFRETYLNNEPSTDTM